MKKKVQQRYGKEEKNHDLIEITSGTCPLYYVEVWEPMS
jgi:hypothetical protein